jgi:hypothetical protein
LCLRGLHLWLHLRQRRWELLWSCCTWI